MKENSKEMIETHMYGLSKIYEHRGPPYLSSTIERVLLTGCLSLTVSGEGL